MNFKYLVITIYLTFVGLIVMMVLKSCNQKFELETKNYYNEELKYQDQIDAKMAGNAYIDSFNVLEINGLVSVTNPQSLISDSIILKFKKPDNEQSDRSFKFINQKIEMKKSEFASGYYDLSIKVYNAGKMKLIEKKVKF